MEEPESNSVPNPDPPEDKANMNLFGRVRTRRG